MPAGEAFSERQQDVVRAIRLAQQQSQLPVSVYVGTLEGDSRATAPAARRSAHEPDRAGRGRPRARRVEVVTGSEVRRRLDDRAAGLAAMTMTSASRPATSRRHRQRGLGAGRARPRAASAAHRHPAAGRLSPPRLGQSLPPWRNDHASVIIGTEPRRIRRGLASVCRGLGPGSGGGVAVLGAQRPGHPVARLDHQPAQRRHRVLAGASQASAASTVDCSASSVGKSPMTMLCAVSLVLVAHTSVSDEKRLTNAAARAARPAGSRRSPRSGSRSAARRRPSPTPTPRPWRRRSAGPRAPQPPAARSRCRRGPARGRPRRRRRDRRRPGGAAGASAGRCRRSARRGSPAPSR